MNKMHILYTNTLYNSSVTAHLDLDPNPEPQSHRAQSEGEGEGNSKICYLLKEGGIIVSNTLNIIVGLLAPRLDLGWPGVNFPIHRIHQNGT